MAPSGILTRGVDTTLQPTVGQLPAPSMRQMPELPTQQCGPAANSLSGAGWAVEMTVLTPAGDTAQVHRIHRSFTISITMLEPMPRCRQNLLTLLHMTRILPMTSWCQG